MGFSPYHTPLQPPQHLICAWLLAAQLGNPCQTNRFLPFHSLIQDSCGDGIEIPLLQIERIDGILFLMLEHAKHINISLTLFLLGIGNAIPVQAFGNTEFYSGKTFLLPRLDVGRRLDLDFDALRRKEIKDSSCGTGSSTTAHSRCDDVFRQIAALRIADQIRKGPGPKIMKGAFTVHSLKAFFATLAYHLYSRKPCCHTSPLYFSQLKHMVAARSNGHSSKHAFTCWNIVYTIYSNSRIPPKKSCQQLMLDSLFYRSNCIKRIIFSARRMTSSFGSRGIA